MQLRALHLCSSDEEALAVSEAISCHDTFESSFHYLENVVHSFLDYFADELSENEVKSAVRSAAIDCWGENAPILASPFKDVPTFTKESSYAADCSDEDATNASQLDSDDDGQLIGEGECELCERTIKLTRHHLIPKSTWPRMKKKLWNAASAIESFSSEGDLDKQNFLRENLQKSLGMGNITDLPSTISHASIRNYLSRVCFVCRQCHSAVHSIHPEWELATEFNTIERLLECQEVRKFAKWANKQRPGRNAVR
eukprot:CCRYP_008212-RA/>CCRYP_008212-RA protein AED:0.40 eAED:0.40 QI:0/-1/0/1/-1/1/1/0/254